MASIILARTVAKQPRERSRQFRQRRRGREHEMRDPERGNQRQQDEADDVVAIEARHGGGYAMADDG